MPIPFDYKLYFQEDEDDFGGEREYWDSGLGAAGCIFIAKDTGRILLAHRSGRVDFEPHTWGTWGGKIDEGETPKDAVVREVEEETGYDGDYRVHFLWTFEDPSAGFQYHNYLIVVPNEFHPQLNWENDDSEWVEYGKWPRPMHFGLKALIQNAGQKLHRVVTLIKRRNAGILEAMDTPPPSAVQKVAHPAPNYNITNAYIVAATLWGEARGEGTKGMQAVMNVIMNRAKGDFKKARDIVLAPKQFSMWNKVSDPESSALKLASNSRNDKVYKEIIAIVDKAMRGALPDITDGATFYFNPKLARPSWAKSMIKTARIGNHDFYKLPPKRKMKEGKIPTVIREMIESQNPYDAVVFKKGIVGDGVWEYELRSPKSYIRYRHEPDTKIFYLDNIGTPVQQDQNKGYAKALLETFFQLIKGYGGALDTESYTTSGMAKIKHVVERFAKQYGVRLVQGRPEVDEAAIHGREFPMKVYHGGEMTAQKPVIFVTRHEHVAQSYAKDRKGKIHTFMLDIKHPARNKDVDAVAKKLGIVGSIGDDSPSYEYLSPAMVGYDKVNAMVRELSKQGFDSAWIDGDFSMEDSFTEYDSFVVWDKSVLKPVDALTEEKLRTLRGSVVARHKNNVGKQVGSQLYVHRDYAPEVIPQAVLQRAQQILDKAYPGFAYNCMVYDAKKGIVRFDQAPDFDTAREPHVGDFVTIFPDGTLPPIKGHSDSIWHHKWLWVKDDYKGFDVDKSKEWSKLWLSKLEGPAKGTDATWKMQLRNVDLLTEEFKDWTDRHWIHYSDVDYLSIRDAKDSQSSIAGDPLGIYMFPEKATENLKYPYFERMKYKMYIQVSKKLNILDLSRITKDILNEFGLTSEQLKQVVHYPGNLIANKTSAPVPTAFWSILRRQSNDSAKFRKLLMSKGYDAVFDDVGAIWSKNEVQLCVFDPSNLKILKIETNNELKSHVDESQDDGVYLGALNADGSNVQPVYSDDQLANHPPHMKVTDRRWRYYPDLKQLDWQGKPTPEEHEGTKEFLAQRGMPVVRVHYLAGLTKKESKLLMEAITDEQAKAAIEFLKKMVSEGPFKGQVYLAGGPVRDMIMGKTPKDLDLSVVSGTIWGALRFTSWLAQQMGNYKGPSGPPPTFDKHIKVDDYGAPSSSPIQDDPAIVRAIEAYDNYYAQYSNPVIFPKFGTAKLNLTGTFNGVDLAGVEVEAVSARKEVYEPGNRKPIRVLPGTLEDDVLRRDFRCNSLMYDLTTNQTIDLTGKGIEDIKNRVLITTSDPELIFREDPLRMMRAVRFMVQKGFGISPETEANIKKNASWLKFISRERVRDEIDKILVTKDPGAAFRKMDELGLLQYVSPEIKQMIGMTQNVHHKHDVFDHTMDVLAKTQPELVRRRMALFHDIGKLVTRTVTPTGVHFIGHEDAGPEIAERVMMSLKYPKTDIDAVKLGIAHHMRLKHGGADAVKLTDKTLRKFKIAVGQYLEHILDVIHADNVSHADASAMPNQVDAVRQRLASLDIKVDKPNLPITGDDLLAIGIKQGPIMGKILSAVTDAWYTNPKITREEAMQIAQQTYGQA